MHKGYVVKAADAVFDNYRWLHSLIHHMAKVEKHIEVLVLSVFSFLVATNLTNVGKSGIAEKNALVLAAAAFTVSFYDLLSRVGESAVQNYCLDRLADGNNVILNTLVYESGVKVAIGVLSLFLGWRADISTEGDFKRWQIPFVILVYALALFASFINMILSFLGGGNPAIFIIACVELYAVRSESKGNRTVRWILVISALVMTILSGLYQVLSLKAYQFCGGWKKRSDLDEDYRERRKFVAKSIGRCIPLSFSEAVKQYLNSKANRCSSSHGDDISTRMSFTELDASIHFDVSLEQNDVVREEEFTGLVNHNGGKPVLGQFDATTCKP